MKDSVEDEKFYTIPRVVALVNKYSRGRVLDVGCGTGAYFKYFKGNEIYGIDLEDRYFKLVDKNKYKAKKIVLKKADMRKIPFKDKSFDFVLSVLVLEYMKTNKELKLAVEELKRVLAPGGTLIVVTPHKNSFTDFVRNQIISKYLSKSREDPNFVMGVARKSEDLERLGFKTKGCLGWVSYKALNNKVLADLLDFIFWNAPFFSGSLIGIYEKS